MDGTWSGWAKLNLAGTRLAALSVAPSRDGFPVVLGVDAQGAPLVFHVGADSPNPVAVGAVWEKPKPVTAVHAQYRFHDGLLDVFAVGADGRLWTARQPEGEPYPRGWTRLSVPGGGIAAVAAANGAENDEPLLVEWAMNALVLTREGRAWVVAEERVGGDWSSTPLYRERDRFTWLRAAPLKDGRLEAFAVSADHRIWHTWQLEPHGPWAGAWRPLHAEGRLVSLEVGTNADGRLELFGVSPDGRVWHTWQIEPEGRWIDRWVELPSGELRTVALAVATVGETERIHLTGLGRDGTVRQTWQTMPGGNWIGSWEPLPAPPVPFVAVAASPDELHLVQAFGLDAEGGAWRSRLLRAD